MSARTMEKLPAAAERLRAERGEIAAAIVATMAGWPKFAQMAADADEFARLQGYALVDYAAALLEGGDETFFHLLLGELAKHLHDPGVAIAETAERTRTLIGAVDAALTAALVGDTAGEAAVAGLADRLEATLLGTAPAEIAVLVVADCLYQDVMSFLIGPALADGVRINWTYVVHPDAKEQRAEVAALADRQFDLVFYSPFTYGRPAEYADLGRPRVALKPGAGRRTAARIGPDAETMIATLVDLFDTPVFVHTAAPLLRRGDQFSEALRDRITGPARRTAARLLTARIRAAVARHEAAGARVRLVDEQAIVAPIGVREASRLLYQAFLQHPARFGMLVAEHLRDAVMVAGRLMKRKVVVCDLDNTLWRGVIGEGLGVAHHGDRHDTLIELKRRGVVLAINSKNDAARVRWDGDGCRLVADDFVSSQINWDPKPLNIQRISDHLNLKAKDFVFVDDRADERALVEEAFPRLLALDALDDRSWRLLALWADLLPAKAGADRTDFYRQRDARLAFLEEDGAAAAEERARTYAGLGLELVVRQAGGDDLARVTELINRTNQFNMTAARIGARQTAGYAASPTARILIADARDRFGGMGTIAALVADETADGVAIPYFVLSCRVFGYGMEFALLEQARRLVRGGALIGPFQESEFNQPCRAVYAQAGFAAAPGGWRLDDAAAKTIAVPEWLSVNATVEPLGTSVALAS